MSTNSFNQEQRELVDLLCYELADVEPVDKAEFQVSGGNENTAQNDLQRLRYYGAHCENIGNAAEIIGLTGLSDYCRRLSDNFFRLSEHGQNRISDSESLVAMHSWSLMLLRYLQHLEDEETTRHHITELVDFLRAPHWPLPLTEPESESIRQDFINSLILTDDDAETGVHPLQADADMVSLRVEDDVRTELLEGFLLEFPVQTLEFTSALNTYAATRETAELQTAQRLAHTIKGAANVVNLHGIANLMHYAEEVMQGISKAKLDVTTELLQLLQEVSDCLETMGEYLLDMGDPPRDSLAILQRLMDVSRAPQTTKVTETRPKSEPNTEMQADGLPQQQAVATPTPQPVNSNQGRAHLRIPDQLVSDLLRLAGENIIANTRVQSVTKHLQHNLTQVADYHQQLLKMAQDLEQMLLVGNQDCAILSGKTLHSEDFDPLELEHYNELHSFSHRLLETATDSSEMLAEIRSNLESLSAINLDQSKLNRENQQQLLRTRMVEVNTLASRLHRCVRQANRLTGKAARLTIIGGDLLVDSRVLSELVDPIMHLLRNAVDHGIASQPHQLPAEAELADDIALAFYRQGDCVSVECRDCGPGLDIARIRCRAVEQGMISAEHATDIGNDEIIRFILAPGFSTRDQVTQTSGRGIGLDVVNTKIRQLNGTLNIESTPGKGTAFTLTLPVNLLSIQALTVISNDYRLALVARDIDQVIYLSPGELVHIDLTGSDLISDNVKNDNFVNNGSQLSYRLHKQWIPVYDLGLLLCSPPQTTVVNRQPVMLTLKRPDKKICGILVDTVLANQEVVIKPLNRFTYRAEGIIGATISGDGLIYPVVDLSSLLSAALEQTGRSLYRSPTGTAISPLHDTDYFHEAHSLHKTDKASPKAQRPLALVVDDSLSSRRSLAQFVSDIGLEVKTARDGFEAIGLIAEKVPALMLVDLEMPRMNGLELTEHLRSKDATRNLPVIMITSRTTNKHRQLAFAAGVSCYIHKPFSEDELLYKIQEHVGSVHEQIAC